MKLAKNIKKGFLSKNLFVYCNILSNALFEKFLCSPLSLHNKNKANEL